MGRLVRDPELHRTGSGVAITNFCVAVDRDYVAKDGGERKTDFINCFARRSTGEFIAKYFTKGRMIVVDGCLEMRDWTDKDGNKRTSAEINVDNTYFGDSKRDGDNGGNQYGGYVPQASFPAPPCSDFAMLEDDDAQLPF